MSPDSIVHLVRLQGKMNMQLEVKVDVWRSSKEENRGALMLAKTGCLATPGCKQATARELRLFLYKGTRVLKNSF